jgi:two-component sensor histidine kinase
MKSLEESVANAERELSERKRIQESLARQTERVAALEESVRQKDILLREIHHRVKNNLQIISSMLCLQMQQVKSRGDRGIFLDLKNRVKAIVSIHELLYKSENAACVGFTDYTRDLAKNIFESYGVSEERVRCSVRDSEVSMDAELAVPIGLIVTELVSNSLKHAFPGERGGTIEIALENPNGKSPVLVVADNGIGIDTEADISQRKSTGLKIVEILAKQIDGEIAISVGKGTMFSIKVGAMPISRGSRS